MNIVILYLWKVKFLINDFFGMVLSKIVAFRSDKQYNATTYFDSETFDLIYKGLPGNINYDDH